MAHAYGAAGERTLLRDVNSLVKQGLIIRRRGECRIAIESVKAFIGSTFVSQDDEKPEVRT